MESLVIDNYINLLAKIEQDKIDSMKLGIIDNNCNNLLFPILIHCTENIELFNSRQLKNINTFINKILYGN